MIRHFPFRAGFVACFLFLSLPVFSQQTAVTDSFKIGLQNAKTDEEKFYYLDHLSRLMMNVNLKEAEKYGEDLIRLAEETRNRNLMVDAYLSNGIRCSYFRGQNEFMFRAIEYFKKALELAKKNKLDDKVAAAQLRLSATYLLIPDKDKALNFINQAFSMISTLDNDSLRVEGHNVYGQVYLARNEKIIALRNYLTALRLTEEIKTENKAEKKLKSILLRNCYLYLSNFYRDIGDYDRAIDYQDAAYKKLDEIDERSVPYQRVIDISSIGNLYSAKKNYDLAIEYFEQSISMADSLKFASLKVPGYLSLLNQYLRLDQPGKALDYLNSGRGQGIKSYLSAFGLSAVIDQAYAVIYTELGKLDSARVRFEKASPYFEQNINETIKINYYTQLANYCGKTGDKVKAIDYLLKVKEMGDRLGELEVVRDAAKDLDSFYAEKKDYTLSRVYNGVYYEYKDSIDKLNKEKELSQVEAADEQQRQTRLAKEREEAKQKRYRIQYFVITIGIAALFILLVMMGMFRVSETTIKAIGFFVFIMLFEFIFLVFKKKISAITHSEPWKDLLFMIGLAVLLLPLHHWLENKVIKYLTSHNRLTSAGHHIRTKWLKRTKKAEE